MEINKIEYAYQYAEGVRDGSISVCKYVRLAVDKYFDQHARADELGIFWDEEDAQYVLSFFELLSFTAGQHAGKPFKLEPWQCFLLANMYGWKKWADNGEAYRLYREVYFEVPKKNGKTELGAGVAIFMMVGDGEAGAQVYTAAYTRDQAKLCFNAAQEMVKKSPEIRSEIRLLTNNMSVPETYSTMSAVSHDAKNSEGKNSHCVIYDEFHVHLTDKLKMSLESGMSARTQPVLFTPTTAGDNKQSPCYEFRTTCINILEGRSDITDTFALIYTLDEGDDWKDEKVWHKANPNLGVSKQLQYLRDKFKKALENGREEVDFKTKQLNMWVDAAVTWIPSETWNALAKPELIHNLSSRAVWYGGLDLGQSRDIASFAAFFPDIVPKTEDRPAIGYLVVKHYCAEEAAENAVRSGIDYKQWIEDGYLIATPGKTTDYNFIKRDIFETAQEWELMFLGYDPYSAPYFKDELAEELGTRWAALPREDGSLNWDYYAKVQVFLQKAAGMAPATKLFEELVLNGLVYHDGNPITAWMLANVALRTDAYGNYTPVKDRSVDKIDGIVASIMSVGSYSKWNLTMGDSKDDGSYGIY
ncbi:terminase large subunit [Dyadobacter fermentans]|uniref:terminase large subunit n=1 Tax=Dyadobacter fermentans TaxID=94254 RepID=UPI001CBFD3E8|nr:terminase TerL endonuclease subunit [Dyadobacter fermentans]MBZ1362147.1 hypothetical protein [Dyadobacter fermentans]